MTKLRSVAAALLVLTFGSGCSGGPLTAADRAGAVAHANLPDRSNPAVRAEEARLARILGADSSINGSPGVCKVRLLGEQAGAYFVWASCTATAPVEPGAPEHSAASLAVRVDGAKVTFPGDLSECPGLYKIFPKHLAELVCEKGYSGQ